MSLETAHFERRKIRTCHALAEKVRDKGSNWDDKYRSRAGELAVVGSSSIHLHAQDGVNLMLAQIVIIDKAIFLSDILAQGPIKGVWGEAPCSTIPTSEGFPDWVGPNDSHQAVFYRRVYS